MGLKSAMRLNETEMEGLNRTERHNANERRKSGRKGGGGGEMEQADVEPIPGLRRNAPATPHRYKEEEKGGGGSGKEEEKVKDADNSRSSLANLQSLKQLYDQLGVQRCEVTFT